MRADEVRKADTLSEASRPPPVTKSESARGGFSAVLGPWVGAPSQAPSQMCPPAVVPAPLDAPALGGIPSPPGAAPALASLALTPARAPTARGSSRAAPPDPLDPATRHSAQLAPLLATSENPSSQVLTDAAAQVTASASLEEVLPALVRRIAWSGDGKRGTLRLEFGQGALAGGTLLVHADDGRVRVELRAPPGTDTSAWKNRIASRLATRGVALEELVVE